MPIAINTGASTGIGKTTAETLAREGYRVFGTSRKTGIVARSVLKWSPAASPISNRSAGWLRTSWLKPDRSTLS